VPQTKISIALATFTIAAGIALTVADAPAASPSLAVGPQYDTTHVYVAPEELDRFVESLIATFGGTKSQAAVINITPTPSETMWQAVFTPVGTFSVFGFKTPIPYPFGIERTGYLVSDFDAAIDSAKANHADIVVTPFPDPIGRDAIIAWPGGVYMQLYWHRTPSNYASLQTVPENRVYISPDRADDFVRDFGAFAQAKVISDDRKAPGIEIGRPNDVYRRARMDSPFGKITVLTTDGHLPYPYGREITGYEVDDLSNTLMKAKAAGASVVIEPYSVAGRRAAMVRFPGGFIAEVHSDNNK
jgi:predicted enzyme related to lactoylglutathione lyase